MFRCFVKVDHPDHGGGNAAYLNPVPDTNAPTDGAARMLAADYALRCWPDNPGRRESFMSRIVTKPLA
jgi:hypothetical protein